jgi:hypothetical protein
VARWANSKRTKEQEKDRHLKTDDYVLQLNASKEGDKVMSAKSTDFLPQVVEILHGHDVENFLLIAQTPDSNRKEGDDFRAVFGGQRDKIVAMLMEIFRRKEDSLGFILDAFVALGHLDKIGKEGELDKLMAELKS